MNINMNRPATNGGSTCVRPDPKAVGDAIRRLRRERHLSQAELARRVEIRAGPMNNLEQGKHLPSARVLFAIAGVLGVPADAVLCPGGTVAYVHPGPSTATGLGSGAGVHAGRPLAECTRLPQEGGVLSAAVLTVLDSVAAAYLALEDLCTAPKRAAISLYVPFETDEAGVLHLVTQVRRLMGIGAAVVFDYLELFENAGLRVVFLRLPDGRDSLSCYDEPNGNAFVFIRRGMNPEKQVFRLLYELGRVYLYARRRYGGGEAAVERGLDEEHAARKFAALFLMPEEAVRTTVTQTGVRPGGWSYELLLRLKHRFGVSAESFAIRLEELALIDVALARRLKERIREHYRRTHFGEPDSSRRILSPNGRLGDLVLTARQTPGAGEEVRRLLAALRRAGVEGTDSAPLRQCQTLAE